MLSLFIESSDSIWQAILEFLGIADKWDKNIAFYVVFGTIVSWLGGNMVFSTESRLASLFSFFNKTVISWIDLFLVIIIGIIITLKFLNPTDEQSAFIHGFSWAAALKYMGGKETNKSTIATS